MIGEYELPQEPLSRAEVYYAILCGQDYPLPPLPLLSREEAYLRYLCENGGGAGGSIAAEYDSTQTYNLGDVVVYDKKLYEALENGITGDWDPDKWAEVTVAELIKAVRESVSDETERALEAEGDLAEQVDNLKSLGRFLAIWDATTGLPTTEPPRGVPFTYSVGDYYRVGAVGQTNYRPNGAQYTGAASTTVETNSLHSGDVYYYDGTQWALQVATGALIIRSSSNITLTDKDHTQIPALTVAQVNQIYTSLESGSSVYVRDTAGNNYCLVRQRAEISSHHTIYMTYLDRLEIAYAVIDNAVTVTFKELGSLPEITFGVEYAGGTTGTLTVNGSLT